LICPPAGLVCSLIGLFRDASRGLAIAGVILSGFELLLVGLPLVAKIVC
jgi:hypothetical protein